MTTVAEPYVLADGESRWLMETGPARFALLARSGDTDGQVMLMQIDMPPGMGPPLHRHDWDEGYLVVSGTFAVRLGEEERELGPGGFVWLPRQLPHGFANTGDAPGRLLGFACPAQGMEDFLVAMREEVAGLDGPPDPEVLMELNARHGITVLGPPIRSAPGR
jgi:quercetin dioxygenase-like cupin family protein